jgi:CDP-glycerol glycerophosphotransferase (TagB/SpsB family)
MVVAHPKQEAQLVAACPAASGHVAVVGDLTLDRLRSSVTNRSHYRQKFGLEDQHKLVVLTTTWGPQSLLSTWSDLPEQLLGVLPLDEYRVALVLHPNIPAHHSKWQLRGWYGNRCMLLLQPPDESWLAALVAADLVIADHGSLALYSAALDRPLLLGAFGAEVADGTAMADLGGQASRLVPGDLLRQIENSLAGHRPGQFTDIASDAFIMNGSSAKLLRDLFYDRMGLRPPWMEPGTVTVPDPPRFPLVTSLDVRVVRCGARKIELRRYAVIPDASRSHAARKDRHLVVFDDESDRIMMQNASVLVKRQPTTHTDAAHRWAVNTLAEQPGARAAVAGCGIRSRSYIVAVRNRPSILVVVDNGPHDPAVVASVVYAFLRPGRLVEGPVQVAIGGRVTTMTLAALDVADQSCNS